MRILACIPARYESTRFPGKPLALIAGRPMIQHVYHCARSCPEITEVYVATDDERISKCVRDFGGKAIITKEDHPSGTDRIAEAVEALDLNNDDLVINIQGDQPLFSPSLISHLIEPLLEDPQLPMSTLQYRITEQGEVADPNFVKMVTDKAGFALYFSRSPIPFFRDSSSGKIYYKHLGFYAYRRAFLRVFAGLPVSHLESSEKLEQLRALENGFRIKVADSLYDSIEIDTPKDIKTVEKMMIGTGADKG
ncbi:MAG: 3-deoxy-manno-octulosonate cytidylyltransferase [Pseudomonadota bacterium]